MSKQKQGGCPKQSRFGNKQRHGNSRSAYFASRQLWRAAQNKARRIKKGGD